MDKIKTGQLIREARKKKNYTQNELGYLLGVTNKAVSRWENGDSFPDIAVLEELARLLDLKIQDIVIGEIQKEDGGIDKDLTEIVRLAKIQMREKKRKLLCTLFYWLLFLGTALIGLGSLRHSFSPSSLHGVEIVCFVGMAFVLTIMARESVRNGVALEKKEGIRKYILLVGVGTFLWSVFMPWIVFLMVTNGILPFGICMESVGPFISYQLVVVYIVDIVILGEEFHRFVRRTGRMQAGYVFAVAGIFNCALLGDFLHRIAVWDAIFPTLAFRTGIVIFEVLCYFLALRFVLKLNKS